jgi:hypothetical protein
MADETRPTTDERLGGNAATKAPAASDETRDGIADPGSRRPPTPTSTDSAPAEASTKPSKPQAEGDLTGEFSEDRFQASDN